MTAKECREVQPGRGGIGGLSANGRKGRFLHGAVLSPQCGQRACLCGETVCGLEAQKLRAACASPGERVCITRWGEPLLGMGLAISTRWPCADGLAGVIGQPAINQPTNQSTNQPTNQSTNQSIAQRSMAALMGSSRRFIDFSLNQKQYGVLTARN